MAWKLLEKMFCVTIYIETKSYKVVQTRFQKKFNFNTFPGKSQISCGIITFKIQTYGTANKRSKKTENPSSRSKLSARSADNVQASRVSVGRSPKSQFEDGVVSAAFRGHRCRESLFRAFICILTEYSKTQTYNN